MEGKRDLEGLEVPESFSSPNICHDVPKLAFCLFSSGLTIQGETLSGT